MTALGNGDAPSATSFAGVNINSASTNNVVGGTTAGGAERHLREQRLRRLDPGRRLDGQPRRGQLHRHRRRPARSTAATCSKGVRIETNASGNTIGGSAAGAGNVISGNDSHGILVRTGADGNVIRGNTIGLDATGTADLGNTGSGVRVGTANNTIGGTGANDRNVISGNDDDGIFANGAAALNNVIRGNYIGTDVDRHGRPRQPLRRRSISTPAPRTTRSAARSPARATSSPATTREA